MKVKCVSISLFESDGVTPKCQLDIIYDTVATNYPYQIYPAGDYTGKPFGKDATRVGAISDIFKYEDQIRYKYESYINSRKQ